MDLIYWNLFFGQHYSSFHVIEPPVFITFLNNRIGTGAYNKTVAGSDLCKTLISADMDN